MQSQDQGPILSEDQVFPVMETKDCYGILDRVFPLGDGGLREVPSECMECPVKTECLRRALSTREGLELKGEMLDRAAATGMMGRLKRWSRKKALSRLIKEEKKKRP
jgi:hypothetical protein